VTSAPTNQDHLPLSDLRRILQPDQLQIVLTDSYFYQLLLQLHLRKLLTCPYRRKELEEGADQLPLSVSPPVPVSPVNILDSSGYSLPLVPLENLLLPACLRLRAGPYSGGFPVFGHPPQSRLYACPVLLVYLPASSAPATHETSTELDQMCSDWCLAFSTCAQVDRPCQTSTEPAKNLNSVFSLNRAPRVHSR